METEQCEKVIKESDIVLEHTDASICVTAQSDTNQVTINIPTKKINKFPHNNILVIRVLSTIGEPDYSVL